MIKVPRWLGIDVFAIAVAVMPLGNLFSGGSFETWLGGVESRPRVRVMLQDDTSG